MCRNIKQQEVIYVNNSSSFSELTVAQVEFYWLTRDSTGYDVKIESKTKKWTSFDFILEAFIMYNLIG